MVFLDTERPTPIRTILTDLYFMGKRVRHVAAVLSEIIHPGDGGRVRTIRELLHRKLKIAPSTQSREMDRFYQAKVRYRRLLYSHTSEKYPWRITLIVNEAQARRDRNLGWTGIAQGGLDVYTAPGDHTTILKQHSKEVAQVILNCINGTHAERDRPSHRTEVPCVVTTSQSSSCSSPR
jgi:thioesterase domain-containing protein